MSASTNAIKWYGATLREVWEELLAKGCPNYFNLKCLGGSWFLDGQYLGEDGPGRESVPPTPAALIEWAATRFAVHHQDGPGVQCVYDPHKYSVEYGKETLEYKNIPMYCLVLGAIETLESKQPAK